MIIGILQCDSIRAEYQDQFDNYPEMFQVLLKKVAPHIETIIYDVEHNEYPNNIQVCDAYITTGSKSSVYEEHAWIKTFQDFVVKLYENRKKLAAICFGHQLVAQALNGQTQKSAKGWGVGVQNIDIYSHKPWMTPKKEHINVLVSHQDQVVKLPEDAEL
ncbi:MAG: GMP synthase, partial [Thiohalomonadales bacterium]